MNEGFARYRETLAEDRRVLFDRYQLVDFAVKAVGIGSIGTLCMVALFISMTGRPLFLQIKEAGRIVLTAELRAAMGVAEGDTVLAKVSDGELRLYRRDTAIRALQERARQLVAPGTLVSDELIKERRDEAANE